MPGQHLDSLSSSPGGRPGPDPSWVPERAAYPPVFVWPPRPLAALAWLPRFVFPYNALYLVMAAGLWWFATPSIETMASLRPGWVLWLLVRNLVLVAVCYGLAHWWLGVRRGQGERWKFNRRWPSSTGTGRTLGGQTRENVWWTLASGVPIATGWEAVTLWLYASGRIPWLSWAGNPVWFVALFPVVVLFREVHFYAVHRLIHWPPLYRRVHSLHHRNTNPGPWSGLSMHPVEHLAYFSSMAFHWVVPTHPVHALANLMSLLVAPIPGHAGFERVALGPAALPTGGYAHYLHHKLFEVNYADGVFPLDRWFGSFHDGSPEADERLRLRHQARRRAGSPLPESAG